MLMGVVTMAELAEIQAIAQLAANLQQQDEAGAGQANQLVGGQAMEED